MGEECAVCAWMETKRKTMKNIDKIRYMNCIKTAARRYLQARQFEECDTPILMPPNGELYNPTFQIEVGGRCRALADSPQRYKMQLFMEGITRYFQFAHCFRPGEAAVGDIAGGGTRAPEFMQLDVELGADSLDGLTAFAGGLLEHILGELGIKAEYTYMEGQECRLLYGDAMKPDLRRRADEVQIVFITHMSLTNGELVDSKELGCRIPAPCHHIFAQPSDIAGLAGMGATDQGADMARLREMTTESFDIVINGIEVGGGDLRIMDRALLERMMELFRVDKGLYQEHLRMLEGYTGPGEAGFALGMERLAMALTGADSISEVSF